MTEGHPAFVANNGRIGFSALATTRRTRPRPGGRSRLVWLAVLRSKAHLSLGAGLDEDALYAGELDALTRERFDAELARPRRRPGRLPPDAGAPVAVGEQAGDHVRPRHRPPRHRAASAAATTATARSSRSARSSTPTARSGTTSRPRSRSRTWGSCAASRRRYMRATPAINDWVAELVAGDDDAARLRVRRAAGAGRDRLHRRRVPPARPVRRRTARCSRRSGARARCRARAPASGSRRWRRCCTATATGGALVTALIAASGMPPRRVGARLPAGLPATRRALPAAATTWPSCRTARTSSWSSQDHVPTRVFMKDIGEEVAVMGDLPLPADVERIRVSASPTDVKALAMLHRCLRRLPALPRRHPRRGRGARPGRVLVARRRHDRRARGGTPGAGRGFAADRPVRARSSSTPA